MPRFMMSFIYRLPVFFSALALVSGLAFFSGNALAAATAAEPPFKVIWKSGGITVTAIQDLPGTMAATLFKGPASDAERGKYFTNGVSEAGYNVFLMQMDGQNILFDTGNGAIRETPGNLVPILAGLGVKAEDINLILLTHLHRDHIGGLMDGNSKAFPNARLMISKPELEYWLGLAGKDPANANGALVKAVVAAYGSSVLPPFALDTVVLPGVTALDAAGHTPGHTVFQVEAEGRKLLIIGDLIHGTPLQFALPDECATFDVDIPMAIESRKRILALAEKENMHIAGMHLPFSGDGTVEKDGLGYTLKTGK
jgi:Zn-dependent hydrolases, including glyoxylases